MNNFQHLPEYVSATHSYRLERLVVSRAPRRSVDRPRTLRRFIAALLPAVRQPAAR